MLHISGSMCMFGDFPAVAVGFYLPMIFIPVFWILQVIYIVSDSKHNLVRYESFTHQIKRQGICHLMHDQPCFLEGIGTLEHLTGPYTLAFRFICLNIGNGAWLPSPGMVDQEFRIDTKQFIQQIFIIIIPRSPD